MPWQSRVHAIVCHPAEQKVLFLRGDNLWRLPRVRLTTEIWEGSAEEVVGAFQTRLASPLWLLRLVDINKDEKRQRVDAVFVMETLDPSWIIPANGRWVDRHHLGSLRIKDERIRPIVDQYFVELESGRVPTQRPPWRRHGWLPVVRNWIEEQVRSLGHRLVALEQVRHWGLAAILRVKTDGPDLYFKESAFSPLLANEAMVTLRLAELFPEYMPVPIAGDAEHNWMLLVDFGPPIGFEVDLEVRREAMRRLADLHIRSVGCTQDLLAEGLLDRRPDVLVDQIDSLFEDEEATSSLTTDEKSQLRSLAPSIKALCRQLDDTGLPATLVHGDFHLGNTARVDGMLRFFDWSDACIAHPLFDLMSLRWEKTESQREILMSNYLDAWRERVKPDTLRGAAKLAKVLTPLHHAVSYQSLIANLEPIAKPELHDMTGEFLREVLTNTRGLNGVEP